MAPDLRNSDDTLRQLARLLSRQIEGKVAAEKLLGPLTSFRLGGPAAVFVEPKNEGDLEAAGAIASSLGVPTLVIGRGSNVLVADSGFPGVVIRVGKGFEWIRQSPEPELIEAGGGASLPQVANYAAKRSLSGLEFAVAIPATVGGGVAMNAGAHGSSVSEVLESVRICRLSVGRTDQVPASALDMTYRKTRLGPDAIVCAACFRLQPGEPAEIELAMKQNRRHRSATQPAQAPNAGSMFKNPSGGSAGSLIESAGLKGTRVGAAEVSDKHGNFFLAFPGATAQDVYDLMVLVQATVFERAGVTLIPEVKLMGEFGGNRRLHFSERQSSERENT